MSADDTIHINRWLTRIAARLREARTARPTCLQALCNATTKPLAPLIQPTFPSFTYLASLLKYLKQCFLFHFNKLQMYLLTILLLKGSLERKICEISHV